MRSGGTANDEQQNEMSFVQLHGTSYQAALLQYIDKDNLPEYLGGNSKATLLDDVGPWKDQKLIDQIEADYRAAGSHSVAAGTVFL